jgi:hypothetical protein
MEQQFLFSEFINLNSDNGRARLLHNREMWRVRGSRDRGSRAQVRQFPNGGLFYASWFIPEAKGPRHRGYLEGHDA